MTPRPAACRACGSTELRRLGRIPSSSVFAGRDLGRLLDGGCLYACAACRLRFRHPVPDPAALRELYEAAFNEEWSRGAERRPDFALTLDFLRSRLGRGRVLDVGCFDGALLAALPSAFERFGIEGNTRAAGLARERGVEIVGTDLHLLPEDARGFDAVTVVDVLEHVPDPAGLLRRLWSRLRPGGLLILSTGTTDAWTWRWLGSRHAYCTLPEHLSFIDAPWLRRLASRLDARVLSLQRFSHGDRRWPGALAEAALQVLLWACPWFFGRLRRARHARSTGRRIDEREIPSPRWLHVRDHVWTALEKAPASSTSPA